MVGVVVILVVMDEPLSSSFATVGHYSGGGGGRRRRSCGQWCTVVVVDRGRQTALQMVISKVQIYIYEIKIYGLVVCDGSTVSRG